MEGYTGIGFQDPPPPPDRPTDRVWRNGDFDLIRERKEGKRCAALDSIGLLYGIGTVV